MNFQVPQFIEVEDKIFGPLSFKQFLYIAGGAGLGYIAYTFTSIPFFIRVLPIALFVGLGFALAFYKVNDRPLINTLEAGLKYLTRGRLYLWRKTPNKTIGPATGQNQKSGIATNLPKISESKLKDLSWSLDVNEKVK